MQATKTAASTAAHSLNHEHVARVGPLIVEMGDNDKDILEWIAKGKSYQELSVHLNKNIGLLRGRYKHLCEILNLSRSFADEDCKAIIVAAMPFVVEEDAKREADRREAARAEARRKASESAQLKKAT
jgi:DNA-binding CsgD family transcriptional regulator